MPHESEPVQDRRQAVEPDGDGASAEVQNELSQAVKIGEQVLGCITGIVQLARLETMLAVKTLPRVLALWMLLFPLVCLVWVSFSVVVSWLVYEYFRAAIWGFVGFFVLQCMALAGCYFVLEAYKRRLGLPHTREHIASAIRSIQHEFKAESKEQ